MAKVNYPSGIAKYRMNGEVVLAQYIGRQEGFDCVVCHKGCNAYTFNIFHTDDINEAYDNPSINANYETWGFGPKHLDEAVELIESYMRIKGNGDTDICVPVIPINFTDEQMNAIRAINEPTRYKAMEQVAKILGIKETYMKTWASSRKTLLMDGHIDVSITYSKGKVVGISFYELNNRKETDRSKWVYYTLGTSLK